MVVLCVCGGLRGCLENRRHLGELRGQQFAEQWTDVDAGKKIARAAGTLGRAGVVAERAIVKCELHERGHGERTAFSDQIRETGFGIRDSGFDGVFVSECQIPESRIPPPESRLRQSFLTVTNVSPSPRQTRICAMRPEGTF